MASRGKSTYTNRVLDFEQVSFHLDKSTAFIMHVRVCLLLPDYLEWPITQQLKLHKLLPSCDTVPAVLLIAYIVFEWLMTMSDKFKWSLFLLYIFHLVFWQLYVYIGQISCFGGISDIIQISDSLFSLWTSGLRLTFITVSTAIRARTVMNQTDKNLCDDNALHHSKIRVSYGS